MYFPFLLLLGAWALLPACSQASQPSAPLVIELRASALLDHARIALADVAVIPADQAELAQVELGKAPRVGYVERLTRAQIEQMLRRQAGVSSVGWSGADSVAVRTQSQTVPATALAEAAVSAVRSQFLPAHPRLEVKVAVNPVSLEVPVGKVELRARLLGSAALTARMSQWIDLLVDGVVYRSAVVQLNVSALQKVYVARRALEQGAWVSADDFAVVDVNVAGVTPVAVGAPLQPFRLREKLKDGQLLVATAQLGGGKVLRGDQVKLVINSGQIGIETAAVAMAEAGPGQMLAVRPVGGSDIVTGRVGRSGAVTIE